MEFSHFFSHTIQLYHLTRLFLHFVPSFQTVLYLRENLLLN